MPLELAVDSQKVYLKGNQIKCHLHTMKILGKSVGTGNRLVIAWGWDRQGGRAGRGGIVSDY